MQLACPDAGEQKTCCHIVDSPINCCMHVEMAAGQTQNPVKRWQNPGKWVESSGENNLS